MGIEQNFAKVFGLALPHWDTQTITKHETLILDTEKAPLVRKGFELYATGKYTLKQIAKFLKDLGLRSYKGNVLAVSCIQRILKSTFYYGIFEFNGETYQGSHEPLISKKLFDKCQEVMKDRGHIMTRKSENFFPFRGLLTCGECKCAITAETQKGHNYYRCTKKREMCSQKYVREEILSEQITNFLQKVSLPSQDAEKVLRELDKDEQKAKEDSKIAVQNFKSELVDTEVKLDKLLSAYLDEVITSEEYAAQKQKMLDQRVELKEKIYKIEDKGVSWLEPARAWVKSLNQAENLLKSGDKSKMTTFLKQIGSNHILIDKSFSFSPKKPFQILAERRVSRRELTSSSLHFPNWRCILKIARTEFCPRPSVAGSGREGKKSERFRIEH